MTLHGALWLLACRAAVLAQHDATTLESHRQHPGRQITAHASPAGNLHERVADIPSPVLSYLIEDGHLNGFTENPRPHRLNERERSVVAATLAGFPPKIRALAERFVVAIYFVDDLGSSAWLEYLDPPARQSFIVFDARVLSETPNAWATRKERSGFADDTALRLEIAETKDDVPGGAFRFIFLHEFGHALGHGLRLHPTWIDQAGGEYAWAQLVGSTEKSFPEVRFYAPPERRLPAARAIDIYARWSRNNYPTLNATIGLEDDFAESFASYVHVHVLQQPYRLIVGDQRYENGILQPRCAARRAFIAKLVDG